MSSKGAARLGDSASCRVCGAPITYAVQGSPNVFINGKPVLRVGDNFAPYTCPNCLTTSPGEKLSQGSSSVFINGIPVGRIGDALTGGGVVISGSSNVFIGDYSDEFTSSSSEINQATGHNNSTNTFTNEMHEKTISVADKTENIIIIGSELVNNSFWLKMMFIACGYAVANGSLTPPGYSHDVDLTTILVIEHGYTELERLKIQELMFNATENITSKKVVLMISKQFQLEQLLLSRNKKAGIHQIKNIVVFAHGFPGSLELNYKGTSLIDINELTINKLTPEMFAEDATFFSYACRTGAGTKDDWLPDNWFGKTDFKPDKSLAQYIANKLRIKVRSFYRRSFYGAVLRDKQTSNDLSKVLAVKRKEENHHRTINISAEHEALFHDGLGDGFIEDIKSIADRGKVAEGVNSYALWRKQGARELPVSGETPSGFPADFASFKPKS